MSSKEHSGCSSKIQPSSGGGHSRGRSYEGGAHLQICFFRGCSYDFIDLQTQSVVRHINATYEEIGNTRKRESFRKPCKNEKLTKQYKGKGYKKNINFVLFVDIY